MIASNVRLALGISGDGGDDGGSGGAGGRRPDMLRKTLWIEREMDWHLRREAYENDVSEAEIIRRLIREHYGI